MKKKKAGKARKVSTATKSSAKKATKKLAKKVAKAPARNVAKPPRAKPTKRVAKSAPKSAKKASKAAARKTVARKPAARKVAAKARAPKKIAPPASRRKAEAPKRKVQAPEPEQLIIEEVSISPAAPVEAEAAAPAVEEGQEVAEIHPSAIEWILSFIDPFENPEEPLFVVTESEQPRIEASDVVNEFLEGLEERGLLLPVEPETWPQFARYRENPEMIAQAEIDDLLRLLSGYVRAAEQEEGLLPAIFERGDVLTLLRRLQELAPGDEPIRIIVD